MTRTRQVRRGRPRSERPRVDNGTPELIMKRLFDLTVEPIDLCLERNLITLAQHWCAIHLRWLYTLRYGAPDIRAVDARHVPGHDVKTRDVNWQSDREKEFSEAIAHLAKAGYLNEVMKLCVYNQRPAFLKTRAELKDMPLDSILPPAQEAALMVIREGLTLLCRLWKRRLS